MWLLRTPLVFLLAAACAEAQTPTRPVVLLLNGYQAVCPFGSSTSASSYGNLQTLLESAGYSVRWVDNCKLHGYFDIPPIEDLANSLGDVIAGLKYPDGTPVTSVYAIAHSMGGLILRSYLSGKQTDPGVFKPPVNHKVVKAVFLASPHLGTTDDMTYYASWNPQVAEMIVGSRFLYDLATWNQGRENLREVDAISVIGNGGTYGGVTGVGDGLVGLTSASLALSLPEERIRVYPYCHSNSSVHVALGKCPGTAVPVATVDTKEHPSWKIIESFFAGTEAWKSVGTSLGADPVLATNAGLMLSPRTSTDEPDTTVTAIWTDRPVATMSGGPYFFNELLPAGAQSLRVLRGTQETVMKVNVTRGGGRVIALKPVGPVIYLVAPAAAAPATLSLAPGTIVAIYGAGLNGATVKVNGTIVRLFYVGDTQVNALLPDGLSGLVKLQAITAQGSVDWNILLEPAVPAIFSADSSGTGPAAGPGTTPYSAGDYVTLYVTGLGGTVTRGGLEWAVLSPTVRVGGLDATVTYAGRAPGWPGLDQINVQVPPGVAQGAVPVVAVSNGRASNAVTITIR